VARYSHPPDTRVLWFFITDAGRSTAERGANRSAAAPQKLTSNYWLEALRLAAANISA